MASPLRLFLRLPVLTLLIVLAGSAAPVLAAPYDGEPKILLHVLPTTTKNLCAAGNLADCASAVTEGSLAGPGGPYYFAYLLAARGDMPDLAAVQFGIDYQGGAPGGRNDGIGVDIFSW